MLTRPNKTETAVHGCHSSGDMAVRMGKTAFAYPDGVLLLVSTKNHDLLPGSTHEVRDSRSSRHSVHAQSEF